MLLRQCLPLFAATSRPFFSFFPALSGAFRIGNLASPYRKCFLGFSAPTITHRWIPQDMYALKISAWRHHALPNPLHRYPFRPNLAALTPRAQRIWPAGLEPPLPAKLSLYVHAKTTQAVWPPPSAWRHRGDRDGGNLQQLMHQKPYFLIVAPHWSTASQPTQVLLPTQICGRWFNSVFRI